ncbi:MAG: hypothetical protein M1836_005180 [Candelina mexicana]|nr:MAG: hypothetical protein M1836_005180 [Candelina mexicana]
MLERAAGCLETSGRHILRASRKSIKTRRMLHSTFWSHGAGDLDLPPWWTTIVQGAFGDGVEAESYRELTTRNAFSNPFGELGLDFLYPTKTLAFIQKCSAYGSERWQCHRVRQSAKQSTRAYTSVAGEGSENDEDDLTFSASSAEGLLQSTSKKQLVLSDDADPFSVLRTRLESASVRDSEEIWQLYCQVKTTPADVSLRVNILGHLACSDRMVDARRSAQLFETIPLLNRNSEVYRHGIESQIKLKNLQKANEIHQEALPRALAQGPLGSDLLLARMIDAHDWLAAYKLWESFQEFKPTTVSESHLWGSVKKLSHIKERALSLAIYASKREQPGNNQTSFSQSQGLLKFVGKVSSIALSFDDDIGAQHVLGLFDKLKRLKLLTAEHYEKAILRLLSVRSNDSLRLAHKLYGAFRNAQHLTPSRPLLRATLKSFCDAYNLIGMRKVMDDWFRIYDGPDSTSYRMLMRSFARQGDVNAVQTLCNAYSSRFNGDFRHLPILLYVHARRGTLEETVKQFREIIAIIPDKLDLMCWNILLYAYAKVDDVDGAVQCFNDLLFDGLKPDDYTFGTLMGVCANRGDVEGVKELLRLSDSHGSKRTVAMVDCVVLAHIKDESLQDAERVIEAAIDMDLEGPRTRMWNYVLTAYAFRLDIGSVTRVHQRMQELGVPGDGMTYAALMQLLAMRGQANAADKLLRSTHHTDPLKITSFHYAIVMGGYLATGELDQVFETYQSMRKAGFSPSAAHKSSLLRASVNVDVTRIANFGSQEQQLTAAETILEQILRSADLSDVAVKAPMKGLGVQSINESYPSMYFDYLIFVYGQRRAFDKVREIYSKYEETAKRLRPAKEVTPSVKALCALMVSHLRQEQWSDLEECWNLAREQAMKVAKPVAITVASEPYQALYHRRFVLCTPLLYYLKALDEQGKYDEMRSTINSLQQNGFALDNKAWNSYIQILTRSYHHLEAFELCERWLVPGWTGWPTKQYRRIRKRQIKNLRADRFKPGRLFPVYQTMVYLAGALMDIRSMGVGDEGKELMAKIRKIAPRTLDAVRGLPRIDDQVQQDILKSW